jgi:protein TonB
VSTGLLQGNSIRQVQPNYPLLARNAQIEGPVQIEIVVDEQGNVVAAEILNGHPLLQQAALEAARQWKFRPTLLNGHPIKISGVLKFTFRLS